MNTGNGTQAKIQDTGDKRWEGKEGEEVVAIVKTRGQERFFGGHLQPFAVEDREKA